MPNDAGALAGTTAVGRPGVLAVPALVPAPWIKAGQRDFTITLTDSMSSPAYVATATRR